MPRDLRHIPPGSQVEVTCRTLESRYFLRPSRDLRDAIHGILARAADRWEVRIVAWFFASNHYHLILRPKDAFHLARFMGDVQGQVAKETNRAIGREGKLWGRRYGPIRMSEDAEVDRLRYLLEQGVKENLIRSPREWPGATSVPWLLGGGPVDAVWFNRTAEYEARRRGERFGKYEYAERYSFELAPLRCWDGLSRAEIRRRIEALIREIEREATERRRTGDAKFLGPQGGPTSRPLGSAGSPKKSKAPRFHAHDRDVWINLQVEYREFRAAYEQASAAFRAGRLDVVFPSGSFPPALPFFPGRPPTPAIVT